MRTRMQSRCEPPVVRQTAFVPIAFTLKGKRHARKLGITLSGSHKLYVTYGNRSHEYHVVHETSMETFSFDTFDDVPQHVPVISP